MDKLIVLGIVGFGAWYFLKPKAAAPNGTVDEAASIDPWTVRENGYVYDGAGRLVLYRGEPIKMGDI